MSPRLTAALADCLADCLDQIEAGVPPAAALAACPEDLRADLARLVETSRALRTLPPHPPRAAFRADLQAELARLETATDRRQPAWAGLPYSRRDGRTAWATRLATVTAVLVFLLAGTVIASASSRPGDRLFPIRQIVVRVWPGFGLTGDRAGDGSTAAELGANKPAGPSSAPTAVVRRGRAEPRAGSPSGLSASAVRYAPPAASGIATPEPAPAAPATAPVAPLMIPTEADNPPTPSSPGPSSPGPSSPHSVPPEDLPPNRLPQPTPAQAGTPTDPPATVIPGPTLAAGGFSVSGQVKRLDGSPEGQPLAGAEVQLFRIDGAPDCALAPGAALGRQITAADGAYRFESLSAGTYLVAAARPRDGGDPECLPLRWHVRGGPAVPGLCDALPSAFTLDDATPGRAWTNIHVLFDGDARCGG